MKISWKLITFIVLCIVTFYLGRSNKESIKTDYKNQIHYTDIFNFLAFMITCIGWMIAFIHHKPDIPSISEKVGNFVVIVKQSNFFEISERLCKMLIEITFYLLPAGVALFCIFVESSKLIIVFKRIVGYIYYNWNKGPTKNIIINTLQQNYPDLPTDISNTILEYVFPSRNSSVNVLLHQCKTFYNFDPIFYDFQDVIDDNYIRNTYTQIGEYCD